MQTAGPVLRYRLLGPLTVFQDGVILNLGTDQHRRALAALLLHANTPVPAAELSAAVWGSDVPADGPAQLRAIIDRLRDLIDPHRQPGTEGELTTAAPDYYSLRVLRSELDATVFEDSLPTAHRLRAEGRWGEAVELLRSGLARWRGVPLTGLDGPSIERLRQRLVDLRGQALEELYEIEVAAGRHQAVVSELMSAATEFPLRERLRAALMVALYRVGRQWDALLQFENYRDLRLRTWGSQPSLDLFSLQQRIRQSDPSLGTPLPAAMPVHIPPPPAAASPPRDRQQVAAQVAAAAVPVVTLAMGSPVLFAVLAIRRRSVWLGLSAAIYLAVVVVMFATNWEDTEAVWSDFVLAGAMLSIVAASVQAAIVVGSPPGKKP